MSETTVRETTRRLPSYTNLFREALLMMEGDPDTAPQDRVLAIMRTRFAQAGGDPRKIGEQTFYQVRYEWRRRLGRPLTREKLAAYGRDDRPGIVRTPMKPPPAVPITPPPANNNKEPAMVGVEEIKAAKVYLKAMGNEVHKAQELLRLMEELLRA